MDLLQVGDVIVADGDNLNFEIVNPWTGKPQNHMTLILFYDMASNMPLGCEIMPTENTAATSSALRRALLRLGKYPRVAYLDNGRAFKASFFKGSQDFETGYGGCLLSLFPFFFPEFKTVWSSFAEFCLRPTVLSGNYIFGNPVQDLQEVPRSHRAS